MRPQGTSAGESPAGCFFPAGFSFKPIQAVLVTTKRCGKRLALDKLQAVVERIDNGVEHPSQPSMSQGSGLSYNSRAKSSIADEAIRSR